MLARRQHGCRIPKSPRIIPPAARVVSEPHQ